jgi:hypothetical protein
VAAAAVESTRRAWPMVARRKNLPADLFAWSTTEFSARDNVMVRGDVDAATYFHDSAVSLFARLKPEELSILRYSDAGVHLYGNAILASSQLIAEKPQVVAAFLRATNRAIVECLANPAQALPPCASASRFSMRSWSWSAGPSPHSTWPRQTRKAMDWATSASV